MFLPRKGGYIPAAFREKQTAWVRLMRMSEVVDGKTREL